MTHGLVWRHNTTCAGDGSCWQNQQSRRPRGVRRVSLHSPTHQRDTSLEGNHWHQSKSSWLLTRRPRDNNRRYVYRRATSSDRPAGAPVIACTTVERLIVRPSATTKKLGGDPTYVRPIMSPAFVVGGIYLRSRCRDLGGAAPRSRVSIWNNRSVATAGRASWVVHRNA